MSCKIQIMTENRALEISSGVVVTDKMLNKNKVPFNDGLFCQKIFGPIKRNTCACNKISIGGICPVCGIEYISSQHSRRERMGIVELNSFVCMPTYIKSIALLLNIAEKTIKDLLYYKKVLILKSKVYDKFSIINRKDIKNKKEAYISGAKSILRLLERIDLKKEFKQLNVSDLNNKDEKRLRLIRDLIESDQSLMDAIVDYVLITPPDLRPITFIDGITPYHKSNDFYRRIISKNRNIERIQKSNAPSIIIRNEQAQLQKAVEDHYLNRRDFFKGKKGVLRGGLLGKRVDFSGRTVIVPGPDLKLGEVGIPIKIALRLFSPFIYRELSIKKKKSKINIDKSIEAISILEKLVEKFSIIVNRQPTLHRLGIQAFNIKLIEDKGCRIHPLVCKGFNADFDGDQMSIHLPLTVEALTEAKLLMGVDRNILQPSDGNITYSPTQDILLGIFYLTTYKKSTIIKWNSDIKSFIQFYELKKTLDKAIPLNKKVFLKLYNEYTTVGRLLFYSYLKEFGFSFEELNKEFDKKQLNNLILNYIKNGNSKEKILKLLDRIKDIGLHYATESGISISIDDMLIPEGKEDKINKGWKLDTKIKAQRELNSLSEEEEYEKLVTLWLKVTDSVKKELVKKIDKICYNPLRIMASSGAKGNISQIRQLSGMRGPMAKSNGKIVPIPITKSFREGLDVGDYFLSIHGSRKGLTDSALRTAEAGYLTRKLVSSVSAVIIDKDDCGTKKGICVPVEKDFILGRILLEDTGGIKKNTIIEEDDFEVLKECGFRTVSIRSPIFCNRNRNCCRRCYGIDNGELPKRLVDISTPIGVIAGESIGEPGTQLTLRTFHTGGTVKTESREIYIKSPFSGKVILKKDDIKNNICIRNTYLIIKTEKGKRKVLLSKNSTLLIEDKEYIEKNKEIAIHPYLKDNSDITGGLPKVTSLLELRQNEDFADISPISGKVSFKIKNKGRCITIKNDKETREIILNNKKIIIVKDKQRIKEGRPLVEGDINIKKVFKKDKKYALEVLLHSLYNIYKNNNVYIKCIHFEVIIASLISIVKIIAPGGSNYINGELINITDVKRKNKNLKSKIKYKRCIKSLTQISNLSESFLSSSAFRDPLTFFTEAALKGQSDPLLGVKENLITGKLINAGTGFFSKHKIDTNRVG